MKVIQKRVVHPNFDIYVFLNNWWNFSKAYINSIKHYKSEHVLVLSMFKKTKHTDMFYYVYMFPWIDYFVLNLIELMFNVL